MDSTLRCAARCDMYTTDMTKTKEYIQSIIFALMATGSVSIDADSKAYTAGGWAGATRSEIEGLPAHELLTLLRRCYKSNGISVIKAARLAHNLSLREAKELCDDVANGAVRVAEPGNIDSIERVRGHEYDGDSWKVHFTLNGRSAVYYTSNPPHPTDHLSVRAERVN